MIRRRVALNLALRHYGGGGTGSLFFVDSAIDNLHPLQILLNDLFPRHFNVLIRIPAPALTNAVNHMLLHQDANLFGQIGSRRQFRHALADNRAFGHLSVSVAD